MNEKELRQIIKEEVQKTLNENYYARGIPEYIVAGVASECAENLQRHLLIFTNQSAQSPKHKQQLLIATREAVESLEKDMKNLIQDKIDLFLRQI